MERNSSPSRGTIFPAALVLCRPRTFADCLSSSGLGLALEPRSDYADYIASWTKVLLTLSDYHREVRDSVDAIAPRSAGALPPIAAREAPLSGPQRRSPPCREVHLIRRFRRLMRFADPSQRQHRADHRLDQAAFDKGRHRVKLAAILPCEHEMVGGILAPCLDMWAPPNCESTAAFIVWIIRSPSKIFVYRPERITLQRRAAAQPSLPGPKHQSRPSLVIRVASPFRELHAPPRCVRGEGRRRSPAAPVRVQRGSSAR